MEVQFSTTGEASPEVRELLWQTFFQSRGRGYNIKAHLPWLDAEINGVVVASLRDSYGNVHGSLLARHLPFHTGGLDATCYAIGYVCVAPEYRGHGLATFLLRSALHSLRQAGVDGVALWTSKPDLYRPLGFEILDTSAIATVSSPPNAWPAVEAISLRWPDSQEVAVRDRGLPPFALHAQRLRTLNGQVEATVLFDPAGASVAEWSGPSAEVALMLLSTLPPKWRLNLLEGDDLPNALRALGAAVTVVPQNLQMWAALTFKQNLQNLHDRAALRILDRI